MSPPVALSHSCHVSLLSHRNVAVRSCNARHLETLADVLGPSRLLMGKGDLTGRFLVAVSNLAQDCGQEVRLGGPSVFDAFCQCPMLNTNGTR